MKRKEWNRVRSEMRRDRDKRTKKRRCYKEQTKKGEEKKRG